MRNERNSGKAMSMMPALRIISRLINNTSLRAAFSIWCGLVASSSAQEPAWSSALGAVSRIQSLHCGLIRCQQVNQRSYVSKGTFNFDRKLGFRYDYQGMGGAYCFINTGDSLYALNLIKKQLICTSRSDTARFAMLYRSLHVLESYLDLSTGDLAWQYRGTVDTSLYLSRIIVAGTQLEEYILIDGAMQRVKLIEYFQPGGPLLFSASLSYRNPSHREVDAFPSAIAFRRYGDDASQKDSVAVLKVRINEGLDSTLFRCPDVAGWRTLALPAPEITGLR
jgi:hypothetical protein